MIKRGTCEFGLKVSLAGAAGAAGAILYNNVAGELSGTLGSPKRETGPYVPAGSLSLEDGTKVLAALAAGPVTGNVFVKALNEKRYTSNVIATSKQGDQKNVIAAGGHTDSVTAGPGINDDGSGAVGLLELALQLTQFRLKNAVRFGFWTAEEYGLVGSEHYVAALNAQETAAIALYLNADMIASPNFGYFIYDGDGSAFNITGPKGSDHIEHLFESYFASIGVRTAPTAFDGRSDYGPFLDVGIPNGGLFTGAEGKKTAEQAAWWGGKAGEAYDPNYHAAGDTIANLAVGAWVVNVKALAHAIAVYSNDLAGIPRGLPAKRSALHKKQAEPDVRRHSACSHEVLSI